MKPMGRPRKSHGRAQRHRKEKPLSLAMKRAIEAARGNGGKLHRCLGGSWADEEHRWNLLYRTTTIQALVDRGLALYTDFRETDVGVFAREPIEVTLTAKGAEFQ